MRTLRLVEHGRPKRLTGEDIKALTEHRVKAHVEYTRRQAQVADAKQERFWAWLLAFFAAVLFAAAAYAAAVEDKIGVGLLVTAVLVAWAVFALVKIPAAYDDEDSE